jgi:hypothetical protein
MKFLKILKEYNQAIIKENQKLKSIYETLLKESDGEDVKLATECDYLKTLKQHMKTTYCLVLSFLLKVEKPMTKVLKMLLKV